MALIFNKTDIITPDDRIIRNVTYAFLKLYANGKDTMQVECELYENKTDVFPLPVKEGEEAVERKSAKGVIVFTINANLDMKDLTEAIHKEVTVKLQELSKDLKINIDAIETITDTSDTKPE